MDNMAITHDHPKQISTKKIEIVAGMSKEQIKFNVR